MTSSVLIRRIHRHGARRPGALAHVFAGTIAAVLVLGPAQAAPPEEIAGLWLTDDGEGAIELRPCGEERCGRVLWMKYPTDENGTVPRDDNNPDPGLRARTICGLTIITGLKPQRDGSWGQGKVYNPDNGSTYDMEIRRQAPDVVKVTGYMGLKLFGQSMDWRRAPKDLPDCTMTASPGSGGRAAAQLKGSPDGAQRPPGRRAPDAPPAPGATGRRPAAAPDRRCSPAPGRSPAGR
jgi:uncharacterized protein (DUF2147 family)